MTKLILAHSVAVVNIQIMAGSLVKVGTAMLTQIKGLPSPISFYNRSKGQPRGQLCELFPPSTLLAFNYFSSGNFPRQISYWTIVIWRLFWNKAANRARYIHSGSSGSGIVGGVGLEKIHLLNSLLCALPDCLLGFQTLHPLLLCKAGCGFCSQLILALTMTIVWANVHTLHITVRLPVRKARLTVTPQG